jgi:hypothetical protein
MNIAFLPFESAYAPSGGIAPVMSHLPAAVSKRSRRRTVVVTPFHHRIDKTANLDLTKVAQVQATFQGEETKVAVKRLKNSGRVEWYFLQLQDDGKLEPRFLSGYPHPYRLDRDILVRDALFFGAAAIRALTCIDANMPWALFLQDWEAATATLAATTVPGRFRTWLTLHNTYDSGAVRDAQLEDVGVDTSLCPGPPHAREASVLERAVRLVEPTVFTVSHQFANDLTSEVLQKEVLAPHLQDSLRGRVVGVDNGPFQERQIPDALIDALRHGDVQALEDWKDSRRDAFLEAVKHFEFSDTPFPASGQTGEHCPLWGDFEAFQTIAEGGSPWIVFGGRDDNRQRGHDVAAHAIADVLERETDVQCLYEPFGSANECSGATVPIARAVGGLIEQVVPLRAAAVYSQAVHVRATEWYSFDSQPTGILYRERDVDGTAESWQGINNAVYDPTGIDVANNRVNERTQYSVFRGMARELRVAIEDAVRIWNDDRELYCRMLIAGLMHIERTFSWERAAEEYIRVLE